MKHTWLLHGAELKYESRPGSYKRMKVEKCPVHGKGCFKSRTFSAKFGRASGLGEEEPFAYLGAWMKLGEDRDRFPDTEAHRKSGWTNELGPSVQEVQAYAKDMGWLLSEEGPGP